MKNEMQARVIYRTNGTRNFSIALMILGAMGILFMHEVEFKLLSAVILGMFHWDFSVDMLSRTVEQTYPDKFRENDDISAGI